MSTPNIRVIQIKNGNRVFVDPFFDGTNLGGGNHTVSFKLSPPHTKIFFSGIPQPYDNNTSIKLNDGTYFYSAKAEGYKDINNQVFVVNGGSIIISENLEPNLNDVKFIVLGETDLSKLDDLEIRVDEQVVELMRDENGDPINYGVDGSNLYVITKLIPGVYTFSAVPKGGTYKPDYGTFEVKNTEVEVELDLTVTLNKPVIIFNSIPKGCNVSLQFNGSQISSGTTPYIPSALSTGTYSYTISKTGYSSYEGTINVQAGQIYYVHIELAETPKLIAVTFAANYAADVFLNGQRQGTTPFVKYYDAYTLGGNDGAGTLNFTASVDNDNPNIVYNAPGQTLDFNINQQVAYTVFFSFQEIQIPEAGTLVNYSCVGYDRYRTEYTGELLPNLTPETRTFLVEKNSSACNYPPIAILSVQSLLQGSNVPAKLKVTTSLGVFTGTSPLSVQEKLGKTVTIELNGDTEYKFNPDVPSVTYTLLESGGLNQTSYVSVAKTHTAYCRIITFWNRAYSPGGAFFISDVSTIFQSSIPGLSVSSTGILVSPTSGRITHDGSSHNDDYFQWQPMASGKIKQNNFDISMVSRSTDRPTATEYGPNTILGHGDGSGYDRIFESWIQIPATNPFDVTIEPIYVKNGAEVNFSDGYAKVSGSEVYVRSNRVNGYPDTQAHRLYYLLRYKSYD